MNNKLNYLSKETLYIDIDLDYFKKNGYCYQELFAYDIPYYHKEVGERKVWYRINDGMIFVDDWYGYLTPTILNYFVQHRNSEDVKYSKIFDYHYLSLRINRLTGEIVNDTYDICQDKNLKQTTCELILPISETNQLLDEINKLTNNKFI